MFLFLAFIQFTVYEKIVDFVVPLMFIPRGSTELAPGLGPANVQFPLDRNVTLTFDYTTGNVTKGTTTK